MKRPTRIQYTIRQVPTPLDEALRRKSRREKKSLNAAIVEVLAEGLRLREEPIRYHDLDYLIGSWVEDPEFDAAVRQFDRINSKLWK